MKMTFPILGVVLAGMLALGSGCAEDDALNLRGGAPSKKSSPAASEETPTPAPGGSGFEGGFK